MGFETFRVELHDGRSHYDEANGTLRKLSHVRPDADSLPLKGSTFYVFDDGEHTIEMELMDSPVRLSCRFTLCHPSSVDAVFLRLVRDLMSRLGMEVTIRDHVRPEHERAFSVDVFAEFSTIVLGGIADRRAEW